MPTHAEHQAAYQKTEKGKDTYQRWRTSEEGKASVARRNRRYRLNHPDRRAANRAVYKAVRRGTLVRADACEHCGIEGFCEASHTDYVKRFDVEWLCRPCHMRKDGLS